ncbi:ATP-binding protein [Actinoallomurus acaciae]|uniref:ATP-binding protein n=1 Tax=Actinoallomurus acaciae TaxID=502577 RepID=A0ABV5YFJ0_9ACTN
MTGTMGTAPDTERERRYRFPLPPHPIAAEQARILTRLALAGWGLNAIAEDALLVAVELVANAVKVGEVFHLTLSRRDGAVLIEVSDSSEACPERQQRSFDRVDGRGLLLVEACSKDWGWRSEATGGKTVWSLIGTPAAQSSPLRT